MTRLPCLLAYALPLLLHTSTSLAFQLPTTVTSTARTLSIVPHASTLDTTDASSIEVIQPQEESSINEPEFNWNKSWYPLVPAEFLDASKPHNYKLLGMDLCLWNDGAESESFEAKTKKPNAIARLFGKKGTPASIGQWHAFEDKCPHRKVPLSEGRVESDGTLLCSYHGWRFDGEGSCVDVPQEASPNRLESIVSNPKSKCNSFPLKIVKGLIWVWPENGKDSILESELTPVSAMADLTDENGQVIPEENVFLGAWNFRELPYGADYFLENVVDPAHVPVSHHNVVGNRYDDPQPLNVSTKKSLTKDGFEIKIQSSNSTTEFVAPALVKIDGDPSTARQCLELYASPSRPGFCNHVGRLNIVKNKDGSLPTAFKMFTQPIPIWANHLLAAKFLNQDALFLHAQERNFHAPGGKYKTSLSSDEDGLAALAENEDYKKLVYTPTDADIGVILFRDWLKKKAGGMIPFRGERTMPPKDNEVVFDQWNSHTKHCKYCLDAYHNTRKIRLATAIMAIGCGIWRPGRFATAASVSLFGGASYLSHKIIKAFHRQEFSHAEND